MKLAASVAKWAGRGTALLLFLFWGAFFVEHVSEWFLHWGGPYPPPWVWVAQFLHLAVLVGFAMMLRWDRFGSLIMLVATVCFYLLIGQGRRPPQVAYLMLMNLVPVLFFAVYWSVSRLREVR